MLIAKKTDQQQEQKLPYLTHELQSIKSVAILMTAFDLAYVPKMLSIPYLTLPYNDNSQI